MRYLRYANMGLELLQFRTKYQKNVVPQARLRFFPILQHFNFDSDLFQIVISSLDIDIYGVRRLRYVRIIIVFLFDRPQRIACNGISRGKRRIRLLFGLFCLSEPPRQILHEIAVPKRISVAAVSESGTFGYSRKKEKLTGIDRKSKKKKKS